MRIWQVQFQVFKSMPSFPRPGELVEEIQTGPEYCLEGRFRKGNPGGQLSITLEGEGGFRIKKQNHRLLPGTAFLALHNDPNHAYFFPEHSKVPWKFLWISLFGNMAELMIKNMVSRYGYLYKLSLKSGITKELSTYRSYRSSAQGLTPFNGVKLVSDVLASLENASIKDTTEQPGSSLIRNAQQLILENLNRNYGVYDIAETLHVSREHLSRIFKDQTGLSPQNYIKFKKIRLACHLLRETRLTCQQVAERIGYENATSFTRAFKTVTKLSPKEFRQVRYIPNF